VRVAIRAGTLGYELKNEETAQVRVAIKAVARGKGLDLTSAGLHLRY
jgi:hypothetical protein